MARKNRVEKSVIFHNRFVDLKELTEFIGAADLYITPYLDEAQSTSGTLAYAFGAGKAVISTPYWHAAELLSNQRGVLVPFADAKAIAREVRGLLRDRTRRLTMSDRAYKLGRAMVWSNTARLYLRAFELARRQKAAAAHEPVSVNGFGPWTYESPELNPDRVYRMPDRTTSFGLRSRSDVAPDASTGPPSR
jgi:glycosyltransferase involved in cell wall biosynthesis